MISIIIPHFERLELLQQTLASLERQSSSSWEAVIVDDGSSAECWKHLKQLASAKIQVLQRTDGDKGPSRCRNIGIQASTAPYIMFLDSDDLLAPNCIQQRLDVAAAHPNCDFWVFPAELFRHTPGDLQQPWNTMTERGDDLERFLRSDGPWCVSSGLWTRQALQRLGGFNERVMYGDDADLHIRALLTGLTFQQFPAQPPDVFVRRSDAPRITGSGHSVALLESRLTRLSEGTRALAAADAGDDLRLTWEGQYFMEGEFLLFNVENPRPWLRRLLRQWQQDFEKYPGTGRRRLVLWYLTWCTCWKTRWYLQVRLARQLMLLCLPPTWFPPRSSTGSAA
ncbi:MAG: glycosyltransferase family 2 protein [Planctomycetaceae bacterium]